MFVLMYQATRRHIPGDYNINTPRIENLKSLTGEVVPELNYALRHEGVCGTGCADPRVLDPCSRWRSVVSVTVRSPSGSTAVVR
jgi:hypothetical protein